MITQLGNLAQPPYETKARLDMKRKLLGVGVGAALLVGLVANGAIAGEITGNGKAIEVHGKSACAFSGLDDADDDGFDRTQSYGQVVRLGYKDQAPSPGDACNPTRGAHE